MARDGHYDAAGYCALCDHPTDGSDILCAACSFQQGEEDGSDDDE